MDDAGRAENREAADNAEAWVPGLLRECFAAGYGNGDFEIGRQACIFAKGQHFRSHHGARDGVDGRLADVDRQAGLCDDADAFAGAEADAAFRRERADGGHYNRAMGDVRVVAGILDDTGHGVAVAERFEGEREGGRFSARQGDLYGVGEFAGDQRLQRRLGGGCGAGARGPAGAQGRVRFVDAGGFGSIAHGVDYRERGVVGKGGNSFRRCIFRASLIGH